jgi:hypothetical protein
MAQPAPPSPQRPGRAVLRGLLDVRPSLGVERAAAAAEDAVAQGLAVAKVYAFASVDYPGAALSLVFDSDSTTAVGGFIFDPGSATSPTTAFTSRAGPTSTPPASSTDSSAAAAPSRGSTSLGPPGPRPLGSTPPATSSESGRMQRDPTASGSRPACSPHRLSARHQHHRLWHQRHRGDRRRLQRRRRRPRHPTDADQEWGIGYGRLHRRPDWAAWPHRSMSQLYEAFRSTPIFNPTPKSRSSSSACIAVGRLHPPPHALHPVRLVVPDDHQRLAVGDLLHEFGSSRVGGASRGTAARR